SKIALVALCQQLKAWGFRIIDTQMETPHLRSLGATLISREYFESILKQETHKDFPPKLWQLEVNWQKPFLAEHVSKQNQSI
ncbi:MAG: leucyl/phenylalanyl-tRNA--protein transferase, partial [Thiomicrospira sp.]